MLCQQHLCQKLPKSVDVRWSYGVQHQCCFFWDSVINSSVFVPSSSLVCVIVLLTWSSAFLLWMLMTGVSVMDCNVLFLLCSHFTVWRSSSTVKLICHNVIVIIWNHKHSVVSQCYVPKLAKFFVEMKPHTKCKKIRMNCEQGIYIYMPSVLWHCWLDSRKSIRPVKNMGMMEVGTA